MTDQQPFVLFRDLQANCSKQWLVHNFLGAGEASAFYGKPGDGKSVLVEDLALHIAAGSPWHGRAVCRGAVVYVALERRSLVIRRAIAFRIKHDAEDLPFAIVGGVRDFREKNTAGTIIDITKKVEAATGEAVVLIVIDTLSRALCGGDENSSKDIGAIVSATAVIQEGTGAHVLWVHHVPIDGGERLRGHGALLGALDTTVQVQRSGHARTAAVVKVNDGPEDESVCFTLESIAIGADTTAPVVMPAQTIVARTEPKLTQNQQTMFSIVHDAGADGLTTDEWNERAREAGIGITRRADLYDFRTALQSKGVVHNNGDRWTVKH